MSKSGLPCAEGRSQHGVCAFHRQMRGRSRSINIVGPIKDHAVGVRLSGEKIGELNAQLSWME